MSLAEKLREFLPTVYERYGPLNARQYAYRAEAEGLIDTSKGKKRPFNYVNKILVELREEGILPWSAVLDSSREFKPFQVLGSEDPESFVKSQMRFFKDSDRMFDLPLWHYQKVVPVIFTEKEGLIPFFQMITDDRAVTVYAQKGQVGKSHFHEYVYPWIMRLCASGKIVRILYLGDCDDEGFQIPLTLLSTLSKWAGGSPRFDIHDLYPRHPSEVHHEDSVVTFERIALLPEQVELYGLSKLPINPKSKIAQKFIDFKCELEALDPNELRRLIEEAINRTWDTTAEERRRQRVEELREIIKAEIEKLTKGWEIDVR
jgi:hypothetical protein